MARKELPRATPPVSSSPRPGATFPVTPLHVGLKGAKPRSDAVATEEPLELRVHDPASGEHRLTVTMRTPGNDFELAAGFLLSEGIVRSPDDIERVQYCVGGPAAQEFNVVTVRLRGSARFDPSAVRAFATTSACGVCGKASLEALEISGAPSLPAGPMVGATALRSLPRSLRARQLEFERTGGMHAAGLFTPAGDALVVREDVGRHNAVDKVIGSLVLGGQFPAGETVLQVSGRASFEIMQKALMAGIPFVSAVGAPSSLAVGVAKEFGMTLAGFVSEEGFNVYAGAERVAIER